MCGIVGYIGNKNAVPILLDGLLRLEYRGYDSAGISVIKNSDITVVKNQGRVLELFNICNNYAIDSSIGIAHTRWATHGKPSKLNAHPHLDNSNTFSVVHNGIIENYQEIKTFLKSKNYQFLSSTDTEVIPNLIHYYFSQTSMKNTKDFLTAVKNAINDFSGSFALEILCKTFPDNMIVVRKDSPIVIGRGLNEFFIASDIPAILSYTNNFYLLNDLEIAYLSKNTIEFYDINLSPIQKNSTVINLNASSVEKGDFEDFMLKEIFEQPKSIRETISVLLDEEKITFPNFSLKQEYLASINQIYIIGCGTAMHAGLGIKPLFQHLLKIPVTVDIASEFRYNESIISNRSLCIFISQSGETADTIAALKLSKSKGAKTIAITNVTGSSITREADFSLYTHAGPEIAVASTKAYTSQLTLLSILAIYMAEIIGFKDKALLDSLKNNLLSIPDKVDLALQSSERLKEIADTIFKEKDIFFLGRGIDHTVALEGSLKLKEITYIHSEAYPAGELKHGPIALIDKDISVISIITNPSLSNKILSNIKEVLSRGAKSIIITSLDDNNYELDSNFLIKLPNIHPFLSPIVAIVPLQLLAYYVSKNKGLDVDKPRNLAKSVTVE